MRPPSTMLQLNTILLLFCAGAILFTNEANAKPQEDMGPDVPDQPKNEETNLKNNDTDSANNTNGNGANETANTGTTPKPKSDKLPYCWAFKDPEFRHYAVSGFVGFGTVLGSAFLIGAVCNLYAYCNAKGQGPDGSKRQQKQPSVKKNAAAGKGKQKQPVKKNPAVARKSPAPVPKAKTNEGKKYKI